jgi:hypothetical protein
MLRRVWFVAILWGRKKALRGSFKDLNFAPTDVTYQGEGCEGQGLKEFNIFFKEE